MHNYSDFNPPNIIIIIMKISIRWGCQGAVAPTIGSFLNDVNLIDCSFSATNENDVILERSYVGPILPLVQRPPGRWSKVVVDWALVSSQSVAVVTSQ